MHKGTKTSVMVPKMQCMSVKVNKLLYSCRMGHKGLWKCIMGCKVNITNVNKDANCV